MTFILFMLLFFIAGILVGIPTAKIFAPPSPTVIITLMCPWLFLYFFSENPLISDIQYIYLSGVIGLFCYWTYFETLKKIKGP